MPVTFTPKPTLASLERSPSFRITMLELEYFGHGVREWGLIPATFPLLMGTKAYGAEVAESRSCFGVSTRHLSYQGCPLLMLRVKHCMRDFKPTYSAEHKAVLTESLKAYKASTGGPNPPIVSLTIGVHPTHLEALASINAPLYDALHNMLRKIAANPKLLWHAPLLLQHGIAADVPAPMEELLIYAPYARQPVWDADKQSLHYGNTHSKRGMLVSSSHFGSQVFTRLAQWQWHRTPLMAHQLATLPTPPASEVQVFFKTSAIALLQSSPNKYHAWMASEIMALQHSHGFYGLVKKLDKHQRALLWQALETARPPKFSTTHAQLMANLNQSAAYQILMGLDMPTPNVSAA